MISTLSLFIANTGTGISSVQSDKGVLKYFPPRFSASDTWSEREAHDSLPEGFPLWDSSLRIPSALKQIKGCEVTQLYHIVLWH